MFYAMFNDVGKLTQFGSARDYEDIALQSALGSIVVIEEIPDSPELYWVDPATSSLLLREECPAVVDKTTIAADGTDSATITGLPDPVMVMIDGERHEVTGGVLELTADVPSTYRLAVDHWPYLPWVLEIVAQ